jgi:FAD binding domain-containing protein/berberine-like enzyme
MGRMTRRRFVQQATFAATALYGRRMNVLAGSAGIVGEQEVNATPLDAATIRKLASRISGRVIRPEEADYESARWVNNHAYDRHPALIVRCNSDSDVARALDFSQSHRLPVAVRSGGHSAAGFGVCDGGVVIDLSGLKRVEVDRRRHVARVEAGCLVGHLDEAAQRFGLATPVGTCPTVGIAGLTLGGGEGALMPKYGATCDNLVSARVVTVDGRQVEASQNSNTDLFWAIRGGGGNFGVVTSLQYELHPVSEVLAGALIYPAGRNRELLQAYVKFTGAAPDEMSAAGLVLPSEQGPRFQVLVCYCGQPSMGNDLLRPLRAQLNPHVDAVRATSYLEAQRNWFPAAAPKPSGYFVANLFLPELSEAAVAVIAAALQDAPRRFMVLIVNFRGAVTRVRSTEMAFAMRRPGYELDVSVHWSAPEERDGAVRWVKALRDELQPFSHGLYVNGLSETSDELVRAAYGPNYTRLVEIKRKYDPTNVLRLNQNIKPV